MPERTKRKIGKHRGSRSCGTGNAKRKRGSGCRGGVGNAGLHKHKWSWVTANDPDRYGREGLKRKRPPGKVMNLYDINSLAEGGKKEMTFKGKVLATGSIRHPVAVKALSWSARAEEKIKAAGGSISKLE
ncbi:MAG: 50S ribosomal protein L15 [bacterium]|nr:50S ribosomal protein L15 [bacterium]